MRLGESEVSDRDRMEGFGINNLYASIYRDEAERLINAASPTHSVGHFGLQSHT